MCVAVLGLVALAAHVVHSQTAPMKIVDAPWEYEPVDPDFWKSALKLLEEKKYGEALDLSLPIEKKYGPSKIEGAEALLISADAFIGMDLSVLAYDNWLTVARTHPNSNPANLALNKISEFHAKNKFPTDQISRLVNEGRQREVPGPAQSMLAYFTALDNMKKGYLEWVDLEIKKIEKGTFWHRQLRFMNALASVRANKIDQAVGELTTLSAETANEGWFKREIDWQLARLYLDQGQYDEAEKIYSGFLFSGRDFGRAMLERAWIRYFKKDYSTSLGILYSMRAPFFDASRTPEQYLLSMLIYRDLCHYTSVQDVAAEFERVFKTPFKEMRHGNLEKVPQLLSMVLVQGNVMPSADLISTVRRQKTRLKDGPVSALAEFLGRYHKILERKETEVRTYLEYQIRDNLELQANRLLEAREQVKLLEYVAGIEKLRIEKGPRREYASVKEEPQKYEKLYWNFKQEFWWDETPNLRVLVKDRCGGGL